MLTAARAPSVPPEAKEAYWGLLGWVERLHGVAEEGYCTSLATRSRTLRNGESTLRPTPTMYNANKCLVYVKCIVECAPSRGWRVWLVSITAGGGGGGQHDTHLSMPLPTMESLEFLTCSSATSRSMLTTSSSLLDSSSMACTKATIGPVTGRMVSVRPCTMQEGWW